MAKSSESDKQSSIHILDVSGDSITGDKVIGDKIGRDKVVHIHPQPIKPLTNTPYKFLTAYAREDKDIFYGRKAVTDSFTGQVPRFKTLVITGASGSGKSSLLNAGIVPRLEENDYFCLIFSEYAKPLEEFQQSLVQQQLLTPEQLSPSLFTLLQQLLDSKSHLVLIFDQFERFFVNVPTSLRHQFIAALAECISSHFSSEQVNFLFVLRQDFLGQMLAEFEVLLPNFIIDSARLNLLPLSLDEAQQAIVEPLEHLDNQQIFYDEDFVKDVLLVDLQAQSEEGIYPPHLQVVCNQLYEAAFAQDKRVIINVNLYQSLGGVQTILQDYLDNAIAQIARDSEQIAVVRSILKTMIESSGTRKFVSLADLQRALSDVAVQEVEAFLEQLRLLRVIEVRAPQYSLSHEFMVEKVRSWFDEREMARQQALETLQRGMAEWQASGALLNEKQVGMIRQWLADDLLEDEQQLLRDSEQVYEARQRREALQKKAAVTAVIAILILAVVSVFFAISSENAKRDAQEQTKIATIEKLAAQSTLAAQLPDESNGYYEHALLLAVQIFKDEDNVTTRSNLLRVLQSQQQRKQFLYGHSSSLTSVAFSPDSKTLASASWDNTIRLWELATGQAKTLSGHSDTVNSVAFSPDGKTLASGSSDKTIRLWELATGQAKTLSGHSDTVDSVAFSPDGKTLASASWDNTIRLWELATGQAKTLSGHSDWVYSVAFSPDGKTLASASSDSTIRLWELATGQAKTLSGHSDSVYSVAFSPDGKTLASGSEDNTIRLWDMATGRALGQPLRRHFRSINSLAFSPDGKTLASASEDKTIKLWELTTGQPKTLNGHFHYINSVTFSPDGKTLASASHDETIRLWKLTTGQTKTLNGHSDFVRSVVFSPDGKTIASGSDDKTVRLWNIITGQHKILHEHSNIAWNVIFSPDGNSLISIGSDDKTIRLWNIVTGQRKILHGHSDIITSMIFSSDSKTLASGSYDETIRLWDTATGQSQILGKHDIPASSLVFSPDGKTLASAHGMYDETVKLWNVTTGQNQVLRGHSSGVRNVVFSPNGKILASGSDDGTVGLWDISTGQNQILRGHSDIIWSMAFSPDGKTLTSASADRTIRLWDVVTGQPLGQPLSEHSDTVWSVAFSPDGKTLASGSWDKTIKLWDVDPESWAKKACAIVNRNFSHKEWQKYMGNRPHEKTCPDLPKDTLGAIELAAEARQHLENGETQQAKAKFKQAREWDNNVVWGDEGLF